MADGRGGPRQPARPAAVSNPQSGARTDGGAGSSKQPLRVASGGAYGERKAATAQQQAAPMAAGGPTAGQNPAGGGQAGAPAGGLESAFGPTNRPAESMMAGAGQPSPMAQNPQATLRALYAVMPHPNIKRMIDQQPGDIR